MGWIRNHAKKIGMSCLAKNNPVKSERWET
jgi:hypothetical protein